MPPIPKTTLKNYCNRCQGITNHHVIIEKIVPSDDPEYRFEVRHYMLNCNGCDEISFRTEAHDFENSYPDEYDDWHHDISIEIYPLPLQNHKPLGETYLLPAKIKNVYLETIDAIKIGSKLLAAVGFRAVIEAVCLDKNIAGKTLEAKINNLLKNRFISDNESERLHAVRFLGNDSVHDITVPKIKALYVVLEIIEHLLKNIYLIDTHANELLDTFIKQFVDFEDLLTRSLKGFKSGDDFPIAKYLGKDVRRLNGQLFKFELELINKINNNEFSLLKVGDKKIFGTNLIDTVQHFIKQ